MATKIIRVRDLGPANGRPSAATIKRWEDRGIFPRRRPFGPGIAGWTEEVFEEGLAQMADNEYVQAEHQRRKAQKAGLHSSAAPGTE
jgi:hypothetical protein